MKSKFWSLIFNPFTRIAGWQAFFVGLAVAGLTAVVGTLSGVVFDGALDAHIVHATTFTASFTLLTINILAVTLLMSLGALVLTRDFRFIDILGTMTLARAPMLLVALAGFIAPSIEPADIVANPLLVLTPAMVVFALFSLIAIVWLITLMYNGMRVSCNVTGAKFTVVFIVALILAEVVSKVAIHHLI